MTQTGVAVTASSALELQKVGAWRGIRVLTWDGAALYGCLGYKIVRLSAAHEIDEVANWEVVARFRPVWWRNVTSRCALSYRLVRDGFHALAILGGGLNDKTLVGAVPGALVTRTADSDEFRITHELHRGTRPLHFAVVPSGRIYWGEYFDNSRREEVHLYASIDQGRTWEIAYTFSAGSIRHVHNMVYDRWGDCLWILTGDEGEECKVLRASCDLRSMEVVLAGSQQARTVALIPTRNGLYFSTDTPCEQNHVYWLDRAGNLEEVGALASSSIFGCKVSSVAGEVIFFSSMVEPSAVNSGRDVDLVGSTDGTNWQVVARWKKDRWPMRHFQYGNALLPDGENTTRYLAATTIAVEANDLVTTLWEVKSA